MNEHKPGLGGLLAHGACCGSLLLIYFAMKNPILLLYVVGPVVLGGILTGAFIGLDRAWTRRRRYREALLKRDERKVLSPAGTGVSSWAEPQESRIIQPRRKQNE